MNKQRPGKSGLTEKAIKASFLKLLDERPLARITVRDITQECGITRNSFYYHYHDIPQLMEQIALDQTNSLIETYPDIRSLDECVEVAFHFIVDNRRAINHIYHSLNREVFEQYLMKICDYSVTTWFQSAFAESAAKEQEMKIRFIRYELFGACIDWMNEGMPPGVKEEAKKLLQICQGLLDV